MDPITNSLAIVYVGVASPGLSSLAVSEQRDEWDFLANPHQQPRYRRQLPATNPMLVFAAKWQSAHARQVPAVITSYTLRPFHGVGVANEDKIALVARLSLPR